MLARDYNTSIKLEKLQIHKKPIINASQKTSIFAIWHSHDDLKKFL
jgi:hypothetical protein